MTIAQEEIFGPVLSIIGYDDEDDAVRIANDTDYGLSGGVWSADAERAKAVARRIRTGQIEVNGGAFNPTPRSVATSSRLRPRVRHARLRGVPRDQVDAAVERTEQRPLCLRLDATAALARRLPLGDRAAGARQRARRDDNMSARRMLGAVVVALLASVAGDGAGERARRPRPRRRRAQGPGRWPVIAQGPHTCTERRPDRSARAPSAPPGRSLWHVSKGKVEGPDGPHHRASRRGRSGLGRADRSGWGLLYAADGVDLPGAPRRLHGATDLQFDIAAYQQSDPDPTDRSRRPDRVEPLRPGRAPQRRRGVHRRRQQRRRPGDRPGRGDDHRPLRARDGRRPTTCRRRLGPAASHDRRRGRPDTGISVGKDGSIYVGELQGFPFRPGTSDVWKIEPGAEGVVCTKGVADAGCELYRSGFTAIQDIAVTRRQQQAVRVRARRRRRPRRSRPASRRASSRLPCCSR